MENLKEIKDYEGYYLSVDGEVISYKGLIPLKLKQQKATQSKKGYYQVRLYKEHVGKLFYIHRLMWETYVGKFPIHKQIDHLDGDTTNNVIGNLQLLTKRQNLKKYHNSEPTYKLRMDREQFIMDYAELKSYRKVAEKHGCSNSTAWYIVNDLVLKVKGDGWEYAPYTKN